MTTLLLIVHGLVSVTLLGAITHSVWLPARRPAGSFVGRFRSVASPSYTNAMAWEFNMPRIAIASESLLSSIALALALSLPDAWAGGDMGDVDDHHDDGPSYFGFVKDGRGAPIADAKVTASVKNGLTLVTRTNATGLYKITSFSKQVRPDEVTISCSKEGYRQARVLRRGPARADQGKAIETECRMERG